MSSSTLRSDGSSSSTSMEARALPPQDSPPLTAISTSGRRRLALPPEIAVRVATFLVPQPDCGARTPSACLRRPPSPFALADLLALASTCLSLRCLLAPLVWSTLVFRCPERLQELREILKHYDGRIPLAAAAAPEPAPQPHDAPSHSGVREHPESPLMGRLVGGGRTMTQPPLPDDGPRLEFELTSFEPGDERPHLPDPLPLVRSLFLAFPRRYSRFDAGAFLALLRHLPSLEYLSWDAELTPPKSLWEFESIGNLRGLHIDAKVFWQGDPGLGKLAGLESFAMTTYDANLLPNHVPTLLLNLPCPLTALDMSTSKTSLLHEERLIDAGCFSRLEHLTLFAVTPEAPLDRALASAGATLRTLHLFADVNGGFRNYDDLWRNLTGQMKVLEVLWLDPMPQQNTAPSFSDFVSATPTLHRINDRETSGLPPCFSMFDPEHPTGALAY